MFFFPIVSFFTIIYTQCAFKSYHLKLSDSLSLLKSNKLVDKAHSCTNLDSLNKTALD